MAHQELGGLNTSLKCHTRGLQLQCSLPRPQLYTVTFPDASLTGAVWKEVLDFGMLLNAGNYSRNT